MNNDIQLPTQCKTEKLKRKKLFWACLISFVVVVSASLALIFINSNRYVPPAFDNNALAGTPNPPEELGYSVASISNGYQVGLSGNLMENNSNVKVYFTSPESNTVWIKLLISDESGATLAETGIIKPGQYIESVQLNKALESSKTPVNLKVMAYEPDTYLSAGSVNLNTVIAHN